LFDRGSIYFSDKDGNQVSAATLKSGYKVAVSPIQITDPNDLYEKIGGLLDVDKEAFLAQVSKKKDPYEEGMHFDYSIECENGFVYKTLPHRRGTIQVMNSDGTPLRCGHKIY
jgi:hypothetical protein